MLAWDPLYHFVNEKEPAVKLSVPASWEPAELDGLLQINQEYRSVFEVFGSLRRSAAGSAHSTASIRGRCHTRGEVESFVRAIQAKGIRFNYVLNASCLGNMEYSKTQRAKLVEELEWIVAISDSVTVAIPYLIELLKKRFPIEIVVSVVAGINTVRQAKFYEELGADRLTLDISVNRNFSLLEAVREAVGCEIELLVNDGCLLHCPYRNYHYNIGSHASQECDIFYMEYPVLKCLLHRLRDPVEFLKMPWIRPEDLETYSAYASVFKIAGREKPTDWILNCVRAYSEGRYKANLLDLITFVSAGSHEFSAAMAGDAPTIYIDNAELNGFLDHFKRTPCLDCETCRYCETVAARVLKANDAEVNRQVHALERFLPYVLRFDQPQYSTADHVVRCVYDAYIKQDLRWKIAKAAARFVRRWM